MAVSADTESPEVIESALGIADTQELHMGSWVMLPFSPFPP